MPTATLRLDVMGKARVGKKPTQEYQIVWRNLQTGQVVTETRTETLNTLRNYVFGQCLNYNFAGAGVVLAGQIWRTYKNQSKRVY